MSRRNSVQSLSLVEIDISKLSDLPLPVYTDDYGLPHSCFCMRYINKSDQDIYISYDGFKKNDIVPAGETVQINFGDNTMEALMGSAGMLCAGTRIHVMLPTKEPGKGTLYIAGYYFMPGR
jgi:hypothetical protein